MLWREENTNQDPEKIVMGFSYTKSHKQDYKTF